MARFTDEELERITQGVDLAALIRSKGIELKKHGAKDLIGHCPFHEDDKPSLIVSPDKNLYHCMGCGKAGNPINFIMEHDGLSFRHAVELLREQHPSIYSGSTAKKVATVRKLESPIKPTAQDFELLDDTIGYYQERLKTASHAQAYLKKRGISQEAIEHFRIGYADRTLGLRLPKADRVEGKETRTKLKRLGILREKTGHEHFNGCVTFPIFNEQGNITEVYGRRFGNQKSGIYHIYLPGKHVGIFNHEALKSKELILCESIIDALTFWTHGHKNVTTIYGTEGFTEEIEQTLITQKVEKVTFAYDNDKAGNRAIERDTERLQSLGIDCFRLTFPYGQDANYYATNGGDLSSLLNAPTWLEPISTSTPLVTNKLVTNSVEPRVSEPTELAGNQLKKVAKDKTDLSLATIKDGEYSLSIADRTYRIRGLHKNNTVEVLKISLRLMIGEYYHLDDLNLSNFKARDAFIRQGAVETLLKPELIKKDLGKLLLLLEQKQEERLKQVDEPLEEIIEITPEEKEEALQLLKHPDLLGKILEDFEHCGLVGEENNKLTGYLATVSRKLNKPLAIIIQSTSAAGKSSLMDAILQMIPKEERIKYSAMTGQSLYYLGESNLKNKILAIVEEEGAEKAAYALKLLQSEGELTIASTGKDDLGRMKTEEYHVEGPVMIFLTTTAIDIDEELMNRCLILTVDESRKQTKRIHELQRLEEKFEGLKQNTLKEKLLRTHQNAQRLLKPVHVVNPYADQLTFLDDKTRTRRDHKKYLTLIKTIALLHQYQRPLRQQDGYEFIEVTINDIASANRIAHEVLGRSLDDLPPQTRKLLIMLKDMVETFAKEKECDVSKIQFTRRQVRRYTGWSDFQIRKHLTRLQELEYIFSFYGSRGQSFVYELFFDGEDISAPQLCGLIDTSKLLDCNYDESSSPKKGSSSPQRAPIKPPSSGDSAPAKNHSNPKNRKASGQ